MCICVCEDVYMSVFVNFYLLLLLLLNAYRWNVLSYKSTTRTTTATNKTKGMSVVMFLKICSSFRFPLTQRGHIFVLTYSNTHIILALYILLLLILGIHEIPDSNTSTTILFSTLDVPFVLQSVVCLTLCIVCNQFL